MWTTHSRHCRAQLQGGLPLSWRHPGAQQLAQACARSQQPAPAAGEACSGRLPKLCGHLHGT